VHYLTDRAARHSRQIRRHHTIAAVAAPAFLPVAMVETYLGAMERPGYDPLSTVIEVPRQIRRQFGTSITVESGS
jgi:hypothetical protein